MPAPVGYVPIAEGPTGYREWRGYQLSESAGSAATVEFRDGAVAAPAAPAAALVAIAGSVDNGAHLYKVTFVTSDGETDASAASNSVTTDAGHGKVNVTIPTGSSRVTARKIYRTTAGGGTYKLLATVSDNTTTVYQDNIADGSLGASAPSTNTSGVLLASIKLAANESRDPVVTVCGIATANGVSVHIASGAVTGTVYGV